MYPRVKFEKFLRKYIEDNFVSTVDAVMAAVKTRPLFHIHVSLQVYITKDPKPPEEMGRLTGQVVIRDLRTKIQTLDHRHN